jgi:YrbI family 3-deoxy-D-manno-octulosonate 8-phosphate phosphatase
MSSNKRSRPSQRGVDSAQKVLAVIPARGGSRGIPRKNLKPLGGDPLIVHTIQHAQAATSIDRVVVSTDDDEIESVARAYGATVVRRPDELSGDTASSESALLHALDRLRDEESYEPELVVFLQATSPIRRPGDVDGAVEELRRTGADSLFSACHVHGFVWRREGDSLHSFSYDYQRRLRRQDSPEDLVENGSIYVFKPWVLRNTGNRLGGRIAVYLMDPLESFQIDEPDDLELAERVLAIRQPAGPAPEWGRVALLVLDFDGVLTDNGVQVGESGTEAVRCDRRDGWGIARLQEAGVPVVVISTERNTVVEARCRKLNVECFSNCCDKLAVLREVAERRGLQAEQIAYVGNDENDVACLKWVGLPIAVGDAGAGARRAARFFTRKSGGHGAVREICDLILSQRRTGQP